jgi:hypothetical protein
MPGFATGETKLLSGDVIAALQPGTRLGEWHIALSNMMSTFQNWLIGLLANGRANSLSDQHSFDHIDADLVAPATIEPGHPG